MSPSLIRSLLIPVLLLLSAAPAAIAQDAPVVPPEVITRVNAVVAPDALLSWSSVTVVLTVTVDAAGVVSDVSVAQSGGEPFDGAAMEAVRQWRFVPAMQGAQAVASRISVSYRFNASPAFPVGAPLAVPPVAVPPSPVADDDHFEATAVVELERRSVDRAASDFVVDRDLLQAAPRQEGAEVLRSAPGVYIARGEGSAVAHSYMLRGFEADHGQDIEFRVGGLPINQPSNVHGQGYADLGFLIGDTVNALHVSEGVYDPRQGDFAVAGSIDLELGVPQAERGMRFETGIGAFGTQRFQWLWAPKDADRETFVAVQGSQTDGFGQNRAGETGSAMMQLRLGGGAWRYRVVGIGYGASSDLAGVVRADDVAADRVCFECVYPYATARGQNAAAGRAMLGAFIDYRGDDSATGELGAWIGYDNLRLRGNTTGFTQTNALDANVPGDLTQQRNRAGSLGLQGRYRRDVFHPEPVDDVHGAIEVGFSGRTDVIDQSQQLLDAAADNRVWSRQIDAGVRSFDLGVWGDSDWQITRFVKARAGVRAALLGYAVHDRATDAVAEHRRSATGAVWGPRASVELSPTKVIAVRAAYGEGYRSPQARSVTDAGDVPFAKVRSADLGVVFDWGPPLQLTVGGYYTRVSDDVAFDAEAGLLEAIGATRRLGAVLQVQTKPWSWLIGSASVTAVDAALVDAPSGGSGTRVPFVPPWVVRADLGAHHTLLRDAGPWKLTGRIGTGLSYLAGRPIPGGDVTEAFSLLDVSAGLDWGPLVLAVEIYNLVDTQYGALVDSFDSNWDDSPSSLPTSALHSVAGSPRSWMVTLGATF